MKNRIDIRKLVPFITLVVILLLFGILTKGKMFTPFNLNSLLNQVVVLLILCSGAIFVVALGCSDLSVGVNAGLSAVVGDVVFTATGSVLLMLLTAFAIGIGLGALNGIINAKFKVPSFMVTLAMLIGVRGIINYIQSFTGLTYAGAFIKAIDKVYIKLPFLLLVLAFSWYFLERTSFGRDIKAIGENEVLAVSVGKPVISLKIICFMISGLTAAIAGMFIIARSGGTTTSMGTMFEMRSLIAIYVGGILVKGGSTASTYKMIIGCLVFVIIENGLKLMGIASSEYSELIEGILLMVILFITIRTEGMSLRSDKKKLAESKTE